MKKELFLLAAILFAFPNLEYSQTELIVNGGFENSTGNQSADRWLFTSNNPGFYIGSWNPYSGSKYAYVGANASGDPIINANGVLSQVVHIPQGVTNVTLRFWLKMTTAETSTTTDYDIMIVSLGNISPILGFTNKSSKGNYEQKSRDIDVTQYQGQDVQLKFEETANAINSTVFRIDDVSLTYVQQFGSVNVTISPNEAISAGAQWNLDGGTWQNSGSTLNNVSIGNHTINYKGVSGWSTPNSQSISVSVNQTFSATGTYTQIQQYGYVSVTIYPNAAVSAGAQWNLDNGTWQNSGTTLNNISTGNHTVYFKSISGWTEPSSKTVGVNANQTTSESGTYTPLTTFSIRIDSVMITQTSIDPGQIGVGSVNRKRINLNQIQVDVRERQEIRFVCTCLDGNSDVSNSSQIDWYSGSTNIGPGRDIKVTALSAGINQISVKASYQGKTANISMASFINVIHYPEIHFPFIGFWKTGSGGSYYNDWLGGGGHGGLFALDFNTGSGPDDWGLPVLSPISGTIRRDIEISAIPGLPAKPWNGHIGGPSEWTRLGGVAIQSDNPSGYTFIILHMSAVFLNSGHVNIGQLIGLCGGRGGLKDNTLSPHIHFEMRKSDGSEVSLPEPITSGNNNFVQQVDNNATLNGQQSITPDEFNYISEKNAVIIGQAQSSGIFGFDHSGILSLNSETMAYYSLGNFKKGDKLTQISFFVPVTQNEKGVSLQNVPNPPAFASAKLSFQNDYFIVYPSIKQGNFYEIPVPSYILPQDNNVSLILKGDKLVFDEVRYRLTSSGSGGNITEGQRVVITRAIYYPDRSLQIDVFNPNSESQFLPKLEIIQTSDGIDEIGVVSRDIGFSIAPNKINTFTLPSINIPDSVEAFVKVYNGIGAFDFAKVDKNITSSVVKFLNGPTKFVLKQNYPNPFNSMTLIEYDLPKDSHVNISVFNTLGQKIISLVNQKQVPGTYKVKFDASDLQSGIYLYHFQTEEFSQTKKLILLK